MLNKTLKLALDSREEIKNFKLVNEEHSSIINIDPEGLSSRSSAFVGNIPYTEIPYQIKGDICHPDTGAVIKENYLFNINGTSNLPKYYEKNKDNIIFHRYYGHVTSGASNAKNKIRLTVEDPENPSTYYYDGNLGTNYSMLNYTQLAHCKSTSGGLIEDAPTVSWSTNDKTTPCYICPHIGYNKVGLEFGEQYEDYPLNGTIKYDENFSKYFNLELEEEEEKFLGWYKVTPKKEYNLETLTGKIWYENTSYSKSPETELFLYEDYINSYRFTVLDAGVYKPFDEASNVETEISDFYYGNGVFRRYLKLEGQIGLDWINLYPYVEEDLKPYINYTNISTYMEENAPIELIRDDKNERFELSIPVKYIQVVQSSADNIITIDIGCKTPNSVADAGGNYLSVHCSFKITELLPEVASINPIQGIKTHTTDILNFSDYTNKVRIGYPGENAYQLKIDPVDKDGNIIENYPCLIVQNIGGNYETASWNAVNIRNANGTFNGFKYNYFMTAAKGYCLDDSNQSHTSGITDISILDERSYNPTIKQVGNFSVIIDGGNLINNGANREPYFYYFYASQYKCSKDENNGMTIKIKKDSLGNRAVNLSVYAKLSYNGVERGYPVNINSFFEFEPKTITNGDISLELDSFGTLMLPENLVEGQEYILNDVIKATSKNDSMIAVEGAVTFVIQG